MTAEETGILDGVQIMAAPASRRFSLIPLPTAPAQRPWLVIFIDPDRPAPGASLRVRLLYLLLRPLRPGFRHVMAISPDGPDHRWLMVNPASDTLAVGCLHSTSVVRELRAAVADGRAHVVAVNARQPPTWKFRGLFTCVAAVAHLTGTKAGPFTTPWRLNQRMKDSQDPL